MRLEALEGLVIFLVFQDGSVLCLWLASSGVFVLFVLIWYDTRVEVCLGRDDNSPPPCLEEGREHSPNSVQLDI